MESITSWSHFFSSTFLFSPLQSVGSQPLPKYLGKIQTRPQYAEGKGRSRKTCTTPDGPVAGLLSKGDYIRGLSQVLEDQQISPLATQNHKSLCRHLNRDQTPTQSKWSQPQIIVSSLHPWGGSWEQKCQVECTFQGQRSGQGAFNSPGPVPGSNCWKIPPDHLPKHSHAVSSCRRF